MGIAAIGTLLAGAAAFGCGTSPPPAAPRAAPATAAPRARATPSSTTVAVTPTTTAPLATPVANAPRSERAPALHNTGSDYVAIFRSLDRYRTWLETSHPDPALADRVWSAYSPLNAKYRRELTWLRRHGWRWFEVGQSSRVEVASVVPATGVVTLRVDEHLPVIEVRDGAGEVAGRRTLGPEFHWIVTLSADSTGRWTIADIGTRLTDVEVQL